MFLDSFPHPWPRELDRHITAVQPTNVPSSRRGRGGRGEPGVQSSLVNEFSSTRVLGH